MGKWVHRLTDVDVQNCTATCAECGIVRIVKHDKTWRCAEGRKRVGSRRFGNSKQRKYRRLISEKTQCSNPECTATIIDPCQLDIHHKDGNHQNNEPSNLEVLCANCHRLAHRPLLLSFSGG